MIPLRSISMVVISPAFFFNVITENELETELENMKLNTSSGFDDVNNKILKKRSPRKFLSHLHKFSTYHSQLA